MEPFDDIFDRSAPDWGRLTSRLDALADEYKVPRDLVRAVVKQESNWDVGAVGDGGRAKGWFQLHPGAATDAGIDPAQRHDPYLNMLGGVRYLRQKLDQAGGDVDKALRLYNGGGDPNYVANVRRHLPQPGTRPGVVSRAASLLSPASAEAAPPQQAPAAAVWDDIFGPQQAPALPPSPPTARSTPEQDAAYRASVSPQGTPAPAPTSQTAPATSAPPAASQGPAGAAPVATPGEAAQTIARLRQQQGEPAAAALAVGGGPTAASQPVTDPAALLAVGRQRPWHEDDPLPPSQRPAVLPSQLEAPLEEGFTRPATMIPLALGIATGGITAGATPVLRAGAEAVTQTAGELGGRWWETGKAPTTQEALETFGWNLVPSAGEELMRGAGRTVARSGRGGQMVLRDQAAMEAQGLGTRVFQAPERARVGQVFDEIAASGVKLDIAPVQTMWHGLAPTERQRALQELRRISSPLAAALESAGPSGAGRLKGWDIGDLQRVRSELLKRRQAVTTPETKDLLWDMRHAVDEAIDQGMAVGRIPAGFAPERLQQAQADWRRIRNADDLQAMVTKHTDFNPNTKFSDLNLAALNKELQGTTKRSQRVMGQMGEAEQATLRQELDALAKRYPFVKIPSLASLVTQTGSLGTAGWMLMTGQPGAAVAAAIPASLSLMLGSPRAMNLFRESIVRRGGKLSANDVALIVNAARRELGYGPAQADTPRQTEGLSASQQAPGGRARMTD